MPVLRTSESYERRVRIGREEGGVCRSLVKSALLSPARIVSSRIALVRRDCCVTAWMSHTAASASGVNVAYSDLLYQGWALVSPVRRVAFFHVRISSFPKFLPSTIC